MNLHFLFPALLLVGCNPQDVTEAKDRFQFIEARDDRPDLVFDRQTGCLAEANGIGWNWVGDEKKGIKDQSAASIDAWVCPQTPDTKASESTP